LVWRSGPCLKGLPTSRPAATRDRPAGHKRIMRQQKMKLYVESPPGSWCYELFLLLPSNWQFMKQSPCHSLEVHECSSNWSTPESVRTSS
jgi:hypothetical protein